eukprot:Lithocolla_globosa_v1_NODE_586_length_3676_cov_4.989506.p2 type:complete len:292 gc:universal NODE_586_length_3676_cov_4.989506:3257-2382(-)
MNESASVVVAKWAPTDPPLKEQPCLLEMDELNWNDNIDIDTLLTDLLAKEQASDVKEDNLKSEQTSFIRPAPKNQHNSCFVTSLFGIFYFTIWQPNKLFLSNLSQLFNPAGGLRLLYTCAQTFEEKEDIKSLNNIRDLLLSWVCDKQKMYLHGEIGNPSLVWNEIVRNENITVRSHFDIRFQFEKTCLGCNRTTTTKTKRDSCLVLSQTDLDRCVDWDGIQEHGNLRHILFSLETNGLPSQGQCTNCHSQDLLISKKIITNWPTFLFIELEEKTEGMNLRRRNFIVITLYL